ncbi:MAG: DUF2461 family protein, partial [Sphingobacteriales bacterium]|nr:DUF2461 family protein [Sphingobacteriales bacterium]
MLQASTITFLNALKENNNKPWFDENRTTYELAKADFYALVEQVIIDIAQFDEPIGLLKVG